MNHPKAKSKMQNITILYLKDNQVNWVPASEQTRKIRDKINLKIKELGSKYFQVKALFDQLNLRRDHLFLKGKELEELFKEQKQGLHLQTQSRRMKEALHCWYAEHFYQEIFDPDTLFLEFLRKGSDVNQIIKPTKAKKASKPKKIDDVRKINNGKRSSKAQKFNKLQSVQIIQNKNQIIQKSQPIEIKADCSVQIFPQNQTTQAHTQFHQFQNEEQISHLENNTPQHNQESISIPTVSNIQANNEVESSDADDVFQGVIEGIDILSNTDGFNFDYSDIFYFQP